MSEKSFKLIVSAFIVLTLALKSTLGAFVVPPPDDLIAMSVRGNLETKGFSVVGPIKFGGRPSVMGVRDECLIYVSAVSAHGWHNAALEKALTGDQRLYFIFEGEIYDKHPPRWAPIANHYLRYFLSYISTSWTFQPVLGLVADDGCQLADIDWNIDTLRYSRSSAPPPGDQ